MVEPEYIERAVADLFEPFSPETLPGPYQDAYLSEDTEGGRLGRLRMYGEIHSLSRTQLETYNQIADSAERSHYLEMQNSTFIINYEKAKQHAWAVENALRQGLDVSTAAENALRQGLDVSTAAENALRQGLDVSTAAENALRQGLDVPTAAENALRQGLDVSTAAENALRQGLDVSTAAENALRQGLDVSTAAVGAANISLQAPQPMNGPAAGGYEGPNVTIHVPRESIKDETEEMIAAGGYEGPNVTIHVPRESIKDGQLDGQQDEPQLKVDAVMNHNEMVNEMNHN
jgi:hypothetical protein